MSDQGHLWSATTRERWFYAAFTASALGVAWLFSPFLDVLLFATVIAVVARPVHTRILPRVGERRLVSALITTLLAALLVFVPLGLVLYLFVRQAMSAARSTRTWLEDGAVEQLVASWQNWAHELGLSSLLGSADGGAWDPFGGTDLVELVRSTLSSGLMSFSSALPTIAGTVFSSLIDVMMFLFTVVTLLAEGPRVVAFVFDLSPLEVRYERRVVEVFQEFAQNWVVGGFVTAAAQGLAATVGYLIVGAPNALFLGVLTGLGSFVPLVGTAVVVLPTTVVVASQHGLMWGGVMLAWGTLVTGSVDNVLRPMLMRGSSDIHPLLIFLAVFGGMSVLGLIGVLVGPMMVAVFLAFATILREEVVPLRPEERAAARTAHDGVGDAEAGGPEG